MQDNTKIEMWDILHLMYPKISYTRFGATSQEKVNNLQHLWSRSRVKYDVHEEQTKCIHLLPSLNQKRTITHRLKILPILTKIRVVYVKGFQL